MIIKVVITANVEMTLKFSIFFSNHSPLITGSVGATNMNATSSRSHAIFTITIERSEKGPDGQQHLRMGKLHMVDLAVSYIEMAFSAGFISLNAAQLHTTYLFTSPTRIFSVAVP